MKHGEVHTIACTPQAKNLALLLDGCGLPERLQGEQRILIKPNLVDDLPPPITTPVELIVDLVQYLRKRCRAELIIAEGTASATRETMDIFGALGYVEAAAGLGVELMDLNREKSVLLRRDDCTRWPEMHLPAVCMESFLLSVPVLKAHTLAGVTLTLKNMMGLAPPAHYCQGGGWKKAAFHHRVHEAVADLNRYRCADFTLLDGSVGMAEAHLWGATCEPPVGLLAAGADPVALDSYGSELLGMDWRDIGHIRQLDGELGQAAPLKISGCSAPGDETP